MFDTVSEIPTPQGSSVVFDTIEDSIIVSGSATVHTVRGAVVPVADQGSTIYYTVRGELFPVPNRGSTTFHSLKAAPVATLFLIRGAQFKINTIGDDRFVSRLTSVLSITFIDLTFTGITTIFTVPSGKTALIHGVVLHSTIGNAATDATSSLGINPSTTNLFALQELVNLRNTNDVWSFWSDKSTTLIAQAGEQIDLNITIAATGGVLGASVYLIGFLI